MAEVKLLSLHDLLRPHLILTLPGQGAVSFRPFAVKDLISLAVRFDIPPVEFAVETLASQAEDLVDANAILRRLPRPTLLRLVRSWAAHPDTFNAVPSQIRNFVDFKQLVEYKVDEWDRRIRELGQRLADQYAAETRQMLSAFSERARQQEDILAKQVKRWAAETQQMLATEFARQQEDIFAKHVKQMSALVAKLDSAASEFEDDARELGNRGWTMPMWGPYETISYLVQFTAEEVSQCLCQEYARSENKREKELFSGLLNSPGLLHWRPLLSECIDAYRERRYRVAVPALLTVVEGAVFSAFNFYSQQTKPQKVAEGACERDPGMIRTVWSSIQAFLAVLFARHAFSDPRPLLINRHWILHGRDVPEWGQIDCLRLFQALDTISVMIRFAHPSRI